MILFPSLANFDSAMVEVDVVADAWAALGGNNAWNDGVVVAEHVVGGPAENVELCPEPAEGNSIADSSLLPYFATS